MLPPGGEADLTEWLWTLPIVGAIVGWGTNLLAVRMLFRPRRPVGPRGFRLQGLIPRRRRELARRIASTVERELVRPSDIHALITDPDLLAAAEKEIDLRVREFLARKVDELPAIALVVLPVDIEDRLRRSIVKHVMEAVPELSAKLGDKLGERLRVSSLVEERVNSFPDERLEEIVLEIARRELRTIEVLGGAIGACVGFVQWAVLHFLAR
jgi:uncharacterized membrane protein YheB (UPF0754 family)